MNQRSKYLRRRIVDVLCHANRGHIGSALSLVEIMQVLFDEVLLFDPEKPKLKTRDRFVLSKAHGGLALYVLLADKGFITEEDLFSFSRFDGLLGGLATAKVPGIDFSTGSLGLGFSLAVGMAVAAKINDEKHRVFTVLGDGECGEGSVWEAAMSASKHALNNLTVIIDCNKLQSYGETSWISKFDPFAEKWRSFGFEVDEVDGHSVDELRSCFAKLPLSNEKPSCIICHTVKGKGLKPAENNAFWHHKARLTPEDHMLMLKDIEEYHAEDMS